MTQCTTVPAPPRRRRRRWRVALVLLGVLVVGLAGACWYIVWAEERDFQAVLAEIDAADPGWRFDDLQAQRAAVPPEQNAALVVGKVYRALGGRGSIFKIGELIGEPPQNELLAADHATALRQFIDAHRTARTLAHQLKDLPRGRYAIDYGFEDANASNEVIFQPLVVAPFLRLDALLAAHEDNGNRAADILRASINNARSMGDEPTIMGLLVYVACMERTHGVLMRVLGQTELPAAELKTLQEMLQQEMEQPRFLWAMRGERAFFVELDRAIRERRITAPNPPRRGWVGQLPDWLTITSADRANSLRARHEMVEASRLPVEQQLDAVRRIVDARFRDEPALGRSFLDAVDEQLRCQAELRCAVLALAAERYRPAEGSWPASTEVLVRGGYVTALPLDPYDARPLRYRRLPDGVMCYSIGPDRVDNGGAVDHTDIGCRLWDPEARRRPAGAALKR